MDVHILRVELRRVSIRPPLSQVLPCIPANNRDSMMSTSVAPSLPDNQPPPGTSQAAVPLHVVAARGWASPLAVFVSAFIVVQSLTGLWVYFAPFSTLTQIQILVHTSAGLVLIVPYLIYQVRHFVVWFRQKWTVVMMIGYLLAAMVVTCMVSGIMVTWQAAMESKLAGFWDWVHLVSGLTTAVLVVVHLALALGRRRVVASKLPEFRHSLRKFGYRGVAWCSAVLCVIVFGSASIGSKVVEFDVPEGYSLSSYVDKIDEYRGNPFAPSYAGTVNGRMIRPEVLSNSEACGSSGCHEQIYQEWLPSAHRFSAMNPPFLAVQRIFAEEREPAETRYCAGCHDPISLFAGAKDIHNQDLSAPGMQEGCSCVTCHSISSVDQRGNADYVLTPPQKYAWEDATGWRKYVSDFLIRAYPRQHVADYDRPVLRTPEFCGTCHKQFIPEALNHTGLSAGQNQFDQWRESHWHTDDVESNLSCVDCHMRLVSDSTDPGRGEPAMPRRSEDDGMHRHHGTIATNMFMPKVMKLPHWERHVQLTEEWIRGETVVDEIAHLWPEGPVASVSIDNPPAEIRPDEETRLHVVVANRKAGHNFTTGPLDFTRAWIHLRVTDALGKTVAEWGAIDPETREITDTAGKRHEIGNSRQEGTLVLESEPLDQQGNPILRHELWNKAGGRGHRVIFPSYSDHQTYVFTIDADVKGPLTATADLNFRRYRQEFLELVVPQMEKESGVYQPTVAQSSDTVTIDVAGSTRDAERASPGEE